MRKTISNMYFTTTAILLVAGITVMGFVQMYLAISYFVSERKKRPQRRGAGGGKAGQPAAAG